MAVEKNSRKGGRKYVLQESGFQKKFTFILNRFWKQKMSANLFIEWWIFSDNIEVF